MSDLKPCPFCGAGLQYCEPVVYVHPIGKCILSGRNFHKGTIGQWNKRTADHALRAGYEMAAREAKARGMTLPGFEQVRGEG